MQWVLEKGILEDCVHPSKEGPGPKESNVGPDKFPKLQ